MMADIVVRWECPTDHLHRLAVREGSSGLIRYCVACKALPMRVLYVHAAENRGVVEALRGMVDLYRHPDSGRVLVEGGASDTDDALIAALVALGEQSIETPSNGQESGRDDA